jgi:hypothetical protein
LALIDELRGRESRGNRKPIQLLKDGPDRLYLYEIGITRWGTEAKPTRGEKAAIGLIFKIFWEWEKTKGVRL